MFTSPLISFVMTISVADMIERNLIANEAISKICDYSVTYFPTSYMLCFTPAGEYTDITDGNNNILAKVKLEIPETIWAMSEEYEHGTVGTIMLPSDY